MLSQFYDNSLILVCSSFITLSTLWPLQDSDVERDSDRERHYGDNSDSAVSDYGSGEKKKKKKHKEKKEKKIKKKKKDDGDRDSSQEETTKVNKSLDI